GVHWRELSPFTVGGIMEAARAEALERSAAFAAAPLFLLSISLGSMVAIDWAQRFPDELAGVVLINTSLAGLSPAYRRLRWRILPEMLIIARERDVARREAGILRLTSNAQPFRRELIDARVQADRRHPVSGRTLLRQLWAAARFRPSLEKPRVPVLLLSGQGDRMVSPRCTEDLAELWNLEPRRHPTAGHDLPLDDPDWTIDSVQQWLSGTPGAGSCPQRVT
ncbi:MAG: alpha/beta hydrolase, partial [Gammaproteobacteria bacterium]|nr:alpha/beta hydrolase [Gammaproteobacteria bacterium]